MNNPMSNERMMEVISTMDVLTHELDGSTLLGLSENFAAIYRSLKNGDIVERATQPGGEHHKSPIPIVIQGECTIVIDSDRSDNSDSGHSLIMSAHAFNDPMSMRLTMGERITSGHIEIFTALAKKLATITAERARYRIKFGREEHDKLHDKIFEPWIEIAIILTQEYEAMRDRLKFQTDNEIMISSEAASLGQEAKLKFTNFTLPASISSDVFEKWLRPLNPIIELTGSHHDCKLSNVVPLGFNGFRARGIEFSPFEIMRTHGKLAHIKSPLLIADPADPEN